jgi:hypothetical protein
MNSEAQQRVLILGDEPRVAIRDASESQRVTIYGSPKFNNARRLKASDLAAIVHSPSSVLKQLNGEFASIVETEDIVSVSTDRFASHQVFYAVHDRRIVISFSYQAMWNWLSTNGHLELDSLAFFEFLHFQRLFGETTFDRSTKTLPPATTLTFNKASGKISPERYWTPNFQKRHDGRSAIASDLADAIKASTNYKVADSTNPMLLLSGGMDSRVALGSFPKNNLPKCVTIGEVENNEVDVAQSLAKIAGAEHSFVKRPSTHYPDLFTKSSNAGGGMYSFQHGHFFDLPLPDTDLIFHGHGFDYFFQGMYLPTTRKTFLGRPTRSWSLDSIEYDLVGQYIDEAKYRLKGLNPSGLLLPDVMKAATERMRDDLESVLGPIRGQTSEPYDEWDYLTTSAPGRHYTYLNLLSIRSLAEQRTIAFDNDILDIFYSTPAEIRNGTQLLAETLRHLNPKLLEVRNANTNLRPDLSPMKLTLHSWNRGLKRRAGIGTSKLGDPTVADRSWPSESEMLRNSPMLMSRIEQLSDSKSIESLGIFENTKIDSIANELREGQTTRAPALLALLTIDEFISHN